MSNSRGLFAELRRRSVFRVAAAYCVVAWLLVQVSDTVFPRLGLPDWTVIAAGTFLFLLPVALFLLVQSRIDARDPKLGAAPADDRLEFA